MITHIAHATLAHSIDLQVGMRLNAAVFETETSTESVRVPVTVTAADPDFIVVDANHPLAGKDLVFEVQAVDVVPGNSRQVGQ